MDIENYLSELTDEQLIAAVKMAETDLANAASENPNSEWHQSCFAGLIIYAGEIRKHGLKVATVH